jgi:hypothetical protein
MKRREVIAGLGGLALWSCRTGSPLRRMIRRADELFFNLANAPIHEHLRL